MSEVGRLDRPGVPNFIAVRPRDGPDGISYYNGKGLTRLAAKAGAMMEAIERYSGERCDEPIHYCDRAHMARKGATLDPGEIIVPPLRDVDDDLRLEWVEGFDLLGQEPAYLPLNDVICPYEPPDGRPAVHYSSTNGLASGNTLEEALCHALCEVVERDSMALAYTSLSLVPAVAGLLASLGVTAGNGTAPGGQQYPLIDLDGLPPRARTFVGKLTAAGLEVYLRDITSRIGIPTLDCTLVERQWDGCHKAHGGCGTHPDARVALFRAITEAAQSRVGCIQGGREDLPEIVRQRVPFDPDEVFGRGERRPFASVLSYEHACVDDDCRFLLRQLRAGGYPRVVAVDLTRREIGVPVVRVVIPGAETWPAFHLHTGRGAIGPRVRMVLRAMAEAPRTTRGRGRPQGRAHEWHSTR